MMGVIVCKIGGSVIDGVDPSIIDDIKEIRAKGYNLILVHGGGVPRRRSLRLLQCQRGVFQIQMFFRAKSRFRLSIFHHIVANTV